MRLTASADGGPRRSGSFSACICSTIVRTTGGQTLKYPCTVTGGMRRSVLAASSKRSAISVTVHFCMLILRDEFDARHAHAGFRGLCEPVIEVGQVVLGDPFAAEFIGAAQRHQRAVAMLLHSGDDGIGQPAAAGGLAVP